MARAHSIAVTLLSGLLAGSALAGNWQSLDAVTTAVEGFVRVSADGPGRVTGIQVDRLDPRLHLRACSSDLHTSRPAGYSSAGRMTVAVRCDDPKPWTLYVPVQVQRELTVVATTRPLQRGRLISAADLEKRRVDVGALRGEYYVDPQQLIGNETGRRLRSGEVLGPRDVKAPRLVRRGQGLLIEAATDAITVNMSGEALEDGSRGDIVRVRNTSSNQIVEARVVDRDRVRVAF